MKKSKFLLIALLLFGLGSKAQVPTNNFSSKKQAENIYTALKPADASPATFSNQESLDAKVPAKKQALLDEIKRNKDNPKEVKHLREELWRFENAIVVKVQ